MSERVVGREPVEIIEFTVPKCANVHGSAPCTATQTGSAKCFNTRSTCNDPDNFQARPGTHLTATEVLEQLKSGDRLSYDADADFFASFDMRFNDDPDGTIFEFGGSGNGAYLGVTAGELVWRVGDETPSAAGGTNTGRIAYDVTPLLGKTLTIYVSIDFAVLSTCTIKLWAYCPIELTLSLLGTDTFTDSSSEWFSGIVSPAVGYTLTFGPTGESADDYNSTITTARLYSATSQPAMDTDPEAHRMKYYFDDGRKAKPRDDIYILPMLTSASTVGSRLNLTASDSRYEPLGRLAFLQLDFADAPHSDHNIDPYRSDREYDPLTRSTFWKKWVIRNKFGRTRGLVRRYTGYDGDRLSDMQRQTYVIDRVGDAMERIKITCRDVLSLTEFRKAQVPAPSPGKLDVALTADATTLYLSGNQETAYPESGTLRIDDELLTYTSRSYDSLDDQTDFNNLVRGTDGSVAEEHDAEEGVQLCRRYTQTRIAPLLEELIIDDARVPAQLVDTAKFASEDEDNLSAYTLTTIISEPTGVAQLIGELGEQCSFYVWWNERRQIVDMQGIKPLDTVDFALTQEDNIVSDSFRIEERPKERLTTISLYYNPRNFAGDLDKSTNFKNQLVVSNSVATGDDLYGKLPQTREIFSRWLRTESQANQTGSRMSIRYEDIPVYATFLIDAKDREIWTGDFISISHDYLVDARGKRLTERRWLVIEAEEVEAGHAQRIVAVDVTLDGLIYKITDNGIGTYTAALFAERNAFITDNAGLNSDGTEGATIG